MGQSWTAQHMDGVCHSEWPWGSRRRRFFLKFHLQVMMGPKHPWGWHLEVDLPQRSLAPGTLCSLQKSAILFKLEGAGCSVANSYLILCDPKDCSTPGSSVSQSLLKFMSIESMMPSNHLIFCIKGGGNSKYLSVFRSDQEGIKIYT